MMMGGRVSIASKDFFDLVHLSSHVGLPKALKDHGTSKLNPATKLINFIPSVAGFLADSW